MFSSVLALKHQSKRDPEHLYACLSDMEKFVAVHPVIRKIENLHPSGFRFYETLRFFYIPFSFQYKVEVLANDKDKSVQMVSNIFGLVDLRLDFIIVPTAEGNHLEEKVYFKAKVPVLGLMKLVFRKQHKKLFQNMEKKVFS
jgi:carbon monoxide dehydrogenase subunit G